MKTFVINLKRSKERTEYIQQHITELKLDYKIIDAIDGSLLSQKDIKACCDMGQVNKLRWWLTDGAIGCALSHYKAYEEFLKSKEKAGFIIEDDVVLPHNIIELLSETELEIEENEIILLYYTSFKPCQLSSVGMKKLLNGSLVYPMDISQAITATAYIIGRKAAQNMIESIKPISVTADCWHYYYKKECFNSFRVHYPSYIRTKNFKSSLDYLKKNSFRAKLSSLIDKYKIPFFYQIVKYLRAKRLDSMLGHFSLTNEISPIYERKLLLPKMYK